MTPEKIKKARLKAKHTQKQAAELISSSVRSWQEYEGDRRKMPKAKWDLYLIRIGEK